MGSFSTFWSNESKYSLCEWSQQQQWKWTPNTLPTLMPSCMYNIFSTRGGFSLLLNSRINVVHRQRNVVGLLNGHAVQYWLSIKRAIAHFHIVHFRYYKKITIWVSRGRLDTPCNRVCISFLWLHLQPSTLRSGGLASWEILQCFKVEWTSSTRLREDVNTRGKELVKKIIPESLPYGGIEMKGVGNCS